MDNEWQPWSADQQEYQDLCDGDDFVAKKIILLTVLNRGSRENGCLHILFYRTGLK